MAQSIKNLIAALWIAISGYLVFTQIWPGYLATAYLKEKIEEKQALIASKTELLKGIEQLREENNSKYSELKRLALVLPEERMFPEILTALENIYSRSGIILPEIEIGDREIKDSGQLGHVRFKSASEATYRQFLFLLGYLEKNIRLFDITSISIGLPQGLTDIDQDPALLFIIEGHFYWLKPAEGNRPSLVPVPSGNPE